MLTSYILSAMFEYYQLPYIYIIIPIVYMFNFFSLPNTPQYLVRKGKIEVSFAILNNELKFSNINLIFFRNIRKRKKP